LVAEVDGEVVGFASSGPERSGDPIFQGEIYALYVRPAYQRRGIRRRLVGTAARRLQQAGISGLLIRVLADNPPARRFYEQLGGQLVRAGEIEIGGARLAQVGYGWLDLQGLAAMSDL
jgi:ribosomal protein S18 acetylase RimI-like enzyme